MNTFLYKLIRGRRWFLLGFALLTVVMWVLALLFSHAPDKTMILILTPLLGPFVYGFFRLLFLIVGKRAPAVFMTVVMCIFGIFSAVDVLCGIAYFAVYFPDGLSPAATAGMGILLGVLDEADKRMKSGTDA